MQLFINNDSTVKQKWSRKKITKKYTYIFYRVNRNIKLDFQPKYLSESQLKAIGLTKFLL